MINLSFNLTNPFSDRFKSYSKTIRVSEYKSLELEFSKDNTIISIYFRWSIWQSHAGIILNIGLLGYSAGVELSDNRHWNYDDGTWEE
jgi:hypothetical protein